MGLWLAGHTRIANSTSHPLCDVVYVAPRMRQTVSAKTHPVHSGAIPLGRVYHGSVAVLGHNPQKRF